MTLSPYKKHLNSKHLNYFLFSLVFIFGISFELRANTLAVPVGGDFQQALNSVQCGDVVVLQAGGTWDVPGPFYNFTFPSKGCTASNPIRVQSSAVASLPNGRVSPADTGNMARLRGRASAAIYFPANSAYWILDGLEITNTGSDSEFVSTLIDGIDQTCHDITIQRSYIHPKETGTDYSRSVNRAIYYNGYNLLFKWNYAAGFMGVSTTDGALMTSAVFLTVKGHHMTLEDNFLEAWYAAIFTGGGQTLPEYTATVSNASTTSALFSNVNGLSPGMVVRFELRGAGTLSGNVLTRTSGEVLDAGDITVAPGANAVWLTPASGGSTTYRFGLTSVSGNNYTLSNFNGGAPSGSYNWTCFQVGIVTSISGNTVNYTPYGVNQLRHNPTPNSQAAWRATSMVHDLTIVRNTFNIDVPNAEYTHSTYNENPKGWWEFKDATDVLIEGNRFTGYPSTMGMVPRSDEGATPWSTMKRITIRNNLFDLTPEAAGAREWFIASGDDNYNSSTPGGSFTITNNLVINVNSIGFVRSFRDSIVAHNTIINAPSAVYGSKVFQSDVTTNNALQLKDNIFANNDYGVTCLGGSLATCFPSLTFLKNAIVDNRNVGNLASQYGAGILSPIRTAYSQVGFTNMSSNDYRLSSTSPYKGLATDGTDPGVNMDALLAVLGGTATPSPTPTPTSTPTPTPTSSPTPTPSPTPGASGSATFVSIDTTSRGNWQGVYGGDGYCVVNLPTSFPAYAQVQTTGQSTYVWSNSTTDVRGLQKISTTDRVAAAWLASSMFTIDINITDGRSHKVTLYNLDWDNNGRLQFIDVIDGNSNALLDTRNVSSFVNGQYVIWNIAGHVKLRVTRSANSPSANAVVSGLFFDPSGSSPTPTPTPTPTPIPSPSPTPSPNNSPAISMTSPTAGATFPTGSNIDIGAIASESGGSVVKVEFFQNGILLGSDTSSPYTFTWSNVSNGNYSLTARATDNKGATTTSSAISISVKTSLKSVGKAKGRGSSLLDATSTASIYAGAADGGTPSESSAQQFVNNLTLLQQDIESAYSDFLVEKNSFGPLADRIDAQLQAALYFCRSDVALAKKTGQTQDVWNHLRRLVAHLSITEDLMVYTNLSNATVAEAQAAKAQTDVMIGNTTLGYAPGAAAVVAPGSLVTALGNLSLTRFGNQLLFAPLSAFGGLAPLELAGVNVTVAGTVAPLIYTSPGRISFYLPMEVPQGAAEVIITSQEGYVTRGMVTVAKNTSQIMTNSDDPSGAASALNANTMSAGPFDLTTGDNFGNDKRTRVTFFATGISGSVANTDTSNDPTVNGMKQPNYAESVSVEARTANGQIVRLPVEFAGAQGIMPGLDQVTVMLMPNLKNAGVIQLTLILNGQVSNAPTIVVR